MIATPAVGLVEAQHLGKTYRGGVRAVDDVTLRIAAGEIYGLVGPNGAGKTTLLRMLTGLIAPTTGRVRIADRERGAVIGSLIEAPAFYPTMSGRRNLALLCRYWGIGPAAADRSLERVGLSPRDGRRPYRHYSLGMKQRLGIAAALLGDPPIVVLDEPTNGLDPESIASVRGIVRALRDGGCAVVLSSHLLAEVEQVADRVGVLAAGRLIAEGTVDELRGRLQVQRSIEIAVNEPESAARIGRELGLRVVDLTGGRLRIDLGESVAPHEVNRRLVEAGIEVNALAETADSLETTFFGLLAAPTPTPTERSTP